MKLTTSSVVLSSLLTLCLAAPHNAHLEERQRDKTYTITCLGPLCTDYPPTTVRLPTSISIPSFPGNPGPDPTSTIKSTPKTTAAPTTKITAAPTTKKTTTSKSTPPVVTSKYTPPPTKTTVKPTSNPTKVTGEPPGPSSTKCPVPRYYQCGGYYDGQPWDGCEVCVPGSNCIWQNDWYWQCVADE